MRHKRAQCGLGGVTNEASSIKCKSMTIRKCTYVEDDAPFFIKMNADVLVLVLSSRSRVASAEK